MSTEHLERTMQMLGAPAVFSRVQVQCKSCGKLHAFDAFDWMEAIQDLSIAVTCSCGGTVGICRKEDNLTFVQGVPDFSKHLPPGINVVFDTGGASDLSQKAAKKPWWKLW